MDTREEVIKLVARLQFRDIETFTKSLCDMNNEIPMTNGWILKWFGRRLSLLAVNEKLKLSYHVCFFSGCENEIRPGHFCDHIVKPAVLTYSQSCPNFESVIYEAMEICEIPERDSIFAYNMLIKFLKAKQDHTITLVKHKANVLLDDTGNTLIVQIGDERTRICGLPGCFMPTLDYYRNKTTRYCVIHAGIEFKKNKLRWKDLVPLFKRVVVGVATRLNENMDPKNVNGWKKVLSEFVQFDEENSFYIPYWIPGEKKQTNIEVVLHANGLLEMNYRDEKVGICNQPFCCTETSNTRSLNPDKDFLDPCVYRCDNHCQEFVLKGEDFIRIYATRATELADQLK